MDAASLASLALVTHASRNAASGRVPFSRSYSATTFEPFHAIHGTPAFCAMIVLPILSPNACMGGPAGPINCIGGFDLASVFGNAGFSDA